MQKFLHKRRVIKSSERLSLVEVIARRVVELTAWPVATPPAPPPFLSGTDRILRPSQAASVLGVSVKTLANWRSKGGGPEYSKAGGIKYLQSDLEAFVSYQRVTSTSEYGHEGESANAVS